MTAVFLVLDCPYCGERFESAADPGGGECQQYIEDCAVCCRPISVRVRLDGDRGASVATRREDEA